MTHRLLLAVAAFVAALVVVAGPGAGPASAGGWAITTMDALPAGGVVPGRATPLGYTIRQHGVTPVELDDSALVVTMTDGRTLRFAGVADGPPGHHVAVVTVPEAGRFALTVDQGWFAPQDLGHLVVGSGSAAAAATPTGSSGGWPPAVRGLLVVATAGALVLLGVEVGAARARRRRTGLAGTGAGG
jgi:hypothetical protein